MKMIHTKQAPSGQWMYQLTSDGKVILDWQYGPYDKKEAIEQARDRFGQDCFPVGMEEGIFAAKQFGAEFQANPGSSRQEYRENAAWYFGKESVSELTTEEALALNTGFYEGIRREKSLQ